MRHCGTRISDCGLAICVVLLTLSTMAPTGFAQSTDDFRKIGIEGHVSLELPRPDYRPLPLDDRTEMILRIGSVTTSTNGPHRYELYYMGFETGEYSLADYLVLPDGSRPDERADIPLQVRATLPEDHDGQLTSYIPRPFPFIGGYRMFLGALGLLWAGGLAAFIVSYRKKRTAVAPIAGVPEPSFAERLRPLVEAAACSGLSTEEQAQLERLLMGYWRDRLHLPESRMADALARLKAHTQAGELLRALERWLHQRAGTSAEEINTLLEPYRSVPVAVQPEGGPS